MTRGFNQYLAPRYFAPRYWGRRYFGIPIATPDGRIVTVREEIRRVTVLAADADVAALSRVVVAPHASRVVFADPDPAYWSRR